MKSRNTKGKDLNESLETDATDASSEIKQGQASWIDVLLYFNYLPYFMFFYYSWYTM